ncbi:MAG: AAA family ATPase [Hyphomonadaceae bacterium]|nr:AAA family ATPase [Hyphomonadaceae bacterium]
MISAQRARTRARHRAKYAPALELTAGDVLQCSDEDEAPFEPPPADDIFGLAECEAEHEETLFADQDEAPFDPPEFEDEPVFSAPAQVATKPEPIVAPPIVEAPPPKDRPLPAISIFAAWDRPEAEALMRELAADQRLARTDMHISRGGIDAAIAHGHADLFLLDTTLDGAAMLAALDRVRAVAPKACIVILGAVNDIALLRELAARGVSDYIVPPAKAGDIARSLCALFADVETAKTIAVIGARGGIGASTIARNIAWSIAERQRQKTTLVDLDLSFGSAAASFRQDTRLSVRDVADAEDCESALASALLLPTPNLQLLPAPVTTAELEIEPAAFDQLIANVRRTATYVVMDLPHAWEPWVRAALREADEVIIVAGPDLASLRNADNMLKLLRSERDKVSAPNVVISMSGAPKRPEIPEKDFTEAIRVKPLLSFAFEPELFASAEMDGQTIYEAAPDSKAALQLDMLASMLTGHEPASQPTPIKVAAKAEAAPLPVLELVTPAPAPSRRQRPARTGFVALQEPVPQQKRRSTGLVRAIAAVAALVAVGVWYAGQHDLADVDAARVVSAFRA